MPKEWEAEQPEEADLKEENKGGKQGICRETLKVALSGDGLFLLKEWWEPCL